MQNPKSHRRLRLSAPFLAAAVAASACVQIKALTRRQTNALEDGCTSATGQAPNLITKQISGRPGAIVNLSLGGDVVHQKLRFRDLNGVAIDVEPSESGNVRLPARAGLYQAELFDVCTQRFSYGLATVNDAYSGFAASATSAAFAVGYYRTWPDASHATADLDGDGKLEYLLASGNNGSGAVVNPGIHIFAFDSGTNAMVFDRTVATANSSLGLKVADLDGDGKLDLIWFSNDSLKLRVAYGDGAGAFSAPADLDLPTTTATGAIYGYDLELADLNRDGRLDFAFSGGVLSGGVTWTAGLVAWYLNLGGRQYETHAVEAGSGHPMFTLQIADADNDGRLDLFAYGQDPSPQLYRFLQQADGTYTASAPGVDHLTSLPAAGAAPHDALRVGYLNSDAYPDAVLIHPDGPSTAYFSNASDLSLAAAAIPSFSGQHGARAWIADLDGDGETEVYLPLKNRALFANKAGLVRRPASELTTGITPNAGNTIVGTTVLGSWAYNSTVPSDLDGDGKLDFVMAVGNAGRIETILGQ